MTKRHTLVNLVYDRNPTRKRTEQNLIVHSGKSEANVTDNKRLRSRYCILLN